MENLSVYNSEQLLRRYKDGQLRIVTYKELKEGDNITFKNERWVDESAIINTIQEARPSLGNFTPKYNTPTSYRVAVL